MLICSSLLLYNLIIQQGCSVTHSFSICLFPQFYVTPLISEICFILLSSAKYCLVSPVRFTNCSAICTYLMTGHYSVKRGSFFPLKCHCTSAYFLNTLIHLSQLGNSLQILFWWTGGSCICSGSWVAITVYWLLWYVARWDKCVAVLWGSCWKQCYGSGKFSFCDPGSLTYWTLLVVVLTNWDSGQSWETVLVGLLSVATNTQHVYIY